MRLLLRKGRVIDPDSGLDETRDVLVEDGKISAVEPRIDASDAETVDLSGRVVCPGLTIHTGHGHLRIRWVAVLPK